MVKNKAAFAPFSLGMLTYIFTLTVSLSSLLVGPYSCIGKQLALMELRMMVALLVTQFDIQFAPGEDGKELLNMSKDFFTVSITSLRLIFTLRATAE